MIRIEGFDDPHHDIKTLEQKSDLTEDEILTIEHDLATYAWWFQDQDALPQDVRFVFFEREGDTYLTCPEVQEAQGFEVDLKELSNARVVGRYRFGEGAGKNPQPYRFPLNQPSSNVRFKLLWVVKQYDKGQCSDEDLEDCLSAVNNLAEFCESRNSVVGKMLGVAPNDPTTLYWERMAALCNALATYLEEDYAKRNMEEQ